MLFALQWFEDLGGFEKAENIQHFVAWSIKAIELFGSRITYWATFNEPTVSSRISSGSASKHSNMATMH
jgi:beta-glucosidase/6-phospho-beta-glucosidase/beta-galactosidase